MQGFSHQLTHSHSVLFLGKIKFFVYSAVSLLYIFAHSADILSFASIVAAFL